MKFLANIQSRIDKIRQLMLDYFVLDQGYKGRELITSLGTSGDIYGTLIALESANTITAIDNTPGGNIEYSSQDIVGGTVIKGNFRGEDITVSTGAFLAYKIN